MDKSENDVNESEVDNETEKISKDTLYICASILISAALICYYLREISINVLY